MRDLIERLRDADPMPEVERLSAEDRREADALLHRLTSEPLPAASPPRRARIRGLALAAGVATVLALVFAAVSLIDDEPGGPGVVERAVAATTDKAAIYHTVALEHLIAAEVPAGALGREAIFESWNAPDGSTHQKTFKVRDGRRGQLLSEAAGRLHPKTRGRFAGPVQIYDPRTNRIQHTRFGRSGKGTSLALNPSVDPGKSLRALQAQGRLRLDGTARVGGREAYRLVSGPVPGFAKGRTESYVYFVDSQTYYPLLIRYRVANGSDKPLELSIRYLVYERLPFDRQHRQLLKLDRHPGAAQYDRDGKRLNP
jgi:hypothetical protein